MDYILWRKAQRSTVVQQGPNNDGTIHGNTCDREIVVFLRSPYLFPPSPMLCLILSGHQNKCKLIAEHMPCDNGVRVRVFVQGALSQNILDLRAPERLRAFRTYVEGEISFEAAADRRWFSIRDRPDIVCLRGRQPACVPYVATWPYSSRAPRHRTVRGA
jgi:hypothetical protein